MGWTGRAPSQNRSENERGAWKHEEQIAISDRQPPESHTIGIDTGKNTPHLIGLDDKGAIVLRENVARGRIATRLAIFSRCMIVIESGMATHYVAREQYDRS
jgi:hypothetical protein